jgi:succinoglycan biosynthesis transport protein ExoP
MSGTNRILPVLWRRRWALISTALLCFAGTVVATFTLPKVYESQAYLLVTPSRGVSSDFEATQLTQILTKTYSELIQTPGLSDAVDRRLGVDGSGSAVSVTAVPQSQLLVLEAEAGSPRLAQELANTYAAEFAARVEDLGRSGNTAGTVSLAEAATLPSSPTRPRPLLNLALGALLALLAGLLAAGLRERLDQRLELDSSTTELLDLPIIGRLPRGANREGGAAALAEASRVLLANLTFANLGERPRTVAVVSASEQEGKSTTSLQLGRAAAELGIEALVVEADLRRPSLLAKLGTNAASRPYGFSTALLHAGVPLDEQVVIPPEGAPDVLIAGPIPPNPAALLGSERFRDFNARARDEYDLVVYDTPPFSAGADASFVAATADAVVLVVDASRNRRTPVTQAVEQLRRVRANVLGIVVNRDAAALDGYYYASHPSATSEVGITAPEPPALAAGSAAARMRLRGQRR